MQTQTHALEELKSFYRSYAKLAGLAKTESLVSSALEFSQDRRIPRAEAARLQQTYQEIQEELGLQSPQDKATSSADQAAPPSPDPS